MALSGTLKDFALPDIFQLIGMQRKTGLLTLESDRETVSVVFETGMVVHADSSVRRLDDLLGNLLVRQGKLRPESLDEALAKQKVSMQRLGFILTNQGYIDRDDLKAALSEQVQQIVFRVFRWKSGRYHFDPNARADYDRQNVIPVGTDQILMEGIRRVDEWPIIEKRIPTLDFVFRPLVPAKQILVVDGLDTDEAGGLEAALVEGGSSSSSESEEIKLTLEEGKIYKLLDGKRSVSVIMDLTGMSDFDVCRTLFDFIDRNLVAPAGQKQAKATPSKVRTAAPSATPGTVALVSVLVLAAVGMLVSSTRPFRVPGQPSLLTSEAANIERSFDMARAERVLAALKAFYLSYGAYPASLDELVNASPALLSADDLLDESGEAFVYEPGRNDELDGASHITLKAIGPTGEPHLSFVREGLRQEGFLPRGASVGSSDRQGSAHE